MQRKCCDCGKEIKNCNGFVMAGDFVKATEGKISFKKVRERCVLCVEKKFTDIE
jgi:hypothetical protein